MIYAIIAAGEGSRLREEGIDVPKPLVEVAGESLIDRLIRIFMNNKAREIVVICNDLTSLVSAHLEKIQHEGLHGNPVPLRFIVKSTPSSMHSMHEISPWLRSGKFILTTVDTIFSEREFARYVDAFSRSDAGGLMGVTDYIEDEKPLYVGVDDDMTVRGYYDEPHGCRYISAGIYGLCPSAIETLEECVRNGEARMRNFQRALLRAGHKLDAFAFTKVIDIDHASDICRAEQMIGYR